MTLEQSPAHSDVLNVYDGFGRIYGSAWGPNIHHGYWENDADDSSVEVATDRLTDLMISGLAAQPGQRVLDIGCGIGYPAQRLVPHFYAGGGGGAPHRDHGGGVSS